MARLSLACLVAFLSLPAYAQEGGVYVAGQGFSLDTAVRHALAENPPGSGKRFWVVVAGSEARRVLKADADAAAVQAVAAARRAGGTVLVCRPDLREARSTELLQGVKAVQGFRAASDLEGGSRAPAPQRDVPLPVGGRATRLILEVCADRDLPPPDSTERTYGR